MPAITISIRNGSTGTVSTATSAADVIAAINKGDDILFNGQTVTVNNIGGQWLVQGQPVETWFFTPVPATGPTVAPIDSMPQPPIPPVFVPQPVIRTDPFPVTAAGTLNLTPGTLLLLAGAAYFLFFRRSS